MRDAAPSTELRAALNMVEWAADPSGRRSAAGIENE